MGKNAKGLTTVLASHAKVPSTANRLPPTMAKTQQEVGTDSRERFEDDMHPDEAGGKGQQQREGEERGRLQLAS
jgi:hypothetical protein